MTRFAYYTLGTEYFLASVFPKKQNLLVPDAYAFFLRYTEHTSLILDTRAKNRLDSSCPIDLWVNSVIPWTLITPLNV